MVALKTCRVSTKTQQKWHFRPAEVVDQACKSTGKSIYEVMFDENEYAASFVIHQKINKDCKANQRSCTRRKIVASIDRLNEGNGSSVKTEDGLFNFHTHPIKCYLDEGTCWGWPSGEDMRETVRFLLRQNVCHFVFAIEGIYGIQVNPNFIDALDDLESDEERGMIICLIETYFKSTHGFRNVSFLQASNHFVTPFDWVDFTNKFNLENVRKNIRNKCSKGLPCNGVPDYSRNGTSRTLTLQEYLIQYDIEPIEMDMDARLRRVDDQGYFDHLQENIDDLIKHFNSYSSPSGWKKGQWFKCTFNPNFFLWGNQKVSLKEWIRKMKSKYPGTYAKQIGNAWQYLDVNDRGFFFSNKEVSIVGPAFLNKGECKIKKL